MKMALASGRDFTDADREGAPSVVIVNETAARRWWPNQDPIGKMLLQQTFSPSAPDATRTLIVIAVARDTKYRDLGEQPRPFVYVPVQQQYVPRTTIVARSTQGQRLAADIRKLLASLNPNLPVVQSQTLEDYAALTLIPQRIAASVAGSLGIVGLLLAAIGIYGVTAYMVSSRTREIGIRVALGAQRGDVVRMVLRQGMMLALMGRDRADARRWRQPPAWIVAVRHRSHRPDRLRWIRHAVLPDRIARVLPARPPRDGRRRDGRAQIRIGFQPSWPICWPAMSVMVF